MNFFKALLYILSNERGELDLSDVDDVEESFEDDNLDLGSDDDDATVPDDSEEPEGEKSLEDQLTELEGEEVDQSDLLKMVNELGILRKGMPVEFDDMEKLKEVVSKGFDYTQKNQELADMRKQAETELSQQREGFEKEMAQFQEEKASHEQMLQTYPTLQATLTEIQNADPDLFAELDARYREVEARMGYQNPTLSKFEERFKSLEEKLESGKSQETDKQLEQIRESWTQELSEVQKSMAPKLRKLGIRPDWKKVQDTWKSDSEGKMSVKQALFAEYGDKMQEALNSLNKLAKTKKVAANKGLDDEQDTGYGMETGNDYVKEALRIASELQEESWHYHIARLQRLQTSLSRIS